MCCINGSVVTESCMRAGGGFGSVAMIRLWAAASHQDSS